MNNLSYLLRILNPFGYNNIAHVDDLKDHISSMYNTPNVFILKNGRDGLYLFLKSLKLPEGSQIALQAFTCNAVVKPVLANNLEPLYIDIDKENFNMSLLDFEKKVNSNVKVLILQHTFGIPASLEIIKKCKELGITIIEDCAHTLGNTKLGNLGDATIFSFGFEKMLSSRVGGALMVNNNTLLSAVEDEYKDVKKIGRMETFLWLLNPIIWRLLRILPEGLSAALGRFLAQTKILNMGFGGPEFSKSDQSLFPKSLSGTLALTVSDCLAGLKSNIQYRNEMVQIYSKSLVTKFSGPLVRYPYIAKDRKQAENYISKIAKLGYPMYDKWFYPVVFPKSTDLKAMKYVVGTCPVAEDISERIVNLPTHSGVTEKKAMEILSILLEK